MSTFTTYSDQPILLELDRSQKIDWGVEMAKAPASWSKTRGKGIKVAVLDTGIDHAHPDLSGNMKIMSNTFDEDSNDTSDPSGHGTHVAGIIAGTDNNKGVVGIAPQADIYGYKVLGDDGTGGFDAIARAIEKAMEHDVDIISMSLGTQEDPGSAFQNVLKKARDAGIILIGATGNSNEHVGWPAAYPEVLAVAANDPVMDKANFSNYGDEVDVSAGGVNIASTYPKKRYALMSGTSMATPIVSGAIALLLAYAKEQGFYGACSPATIKDMITQSAVAPGDDDETDMFGSGMIHISRLLETANDTLT